MLYASSDTPRDLVVGRACLVADVTEPCSLTSLPPFDQVEELLQEEALTQELVMQERDQGRVTLEDQLEQARAAVQALRVRIWGHVAFEVMEESAGSVAGSRESVRGL
jgi:hypothetical protein